MAMGIIDNILNKVGYVREKKMAGFMTGEIESSPGKALEAGKNLEYKNFIDAFNRLPWLFAGSIALARAAIKPKLRLYKGKGKKREEIENDNLLLLLEKPNKFLSYVELIQTSVINLLLTGQQYWNLVGTQENNIISSANLPVEIWWVKPEQIEPISHPTEFISRYDFITTTGKRIPLDPTEVIHFKQPNPDSYFRGTGAFPAGENAAILEFYSVAYNKSFLENDGAMSGNYHFPSKPEKKALREFKRWQENRHRGPGKAGKFGITYGDIEYKEIGKTPKDLQYAEMRKMNREEILATLGVPPSIVGLLEYANYSNMEVQQKKFWMDTVIPMMMLIESKLTLQLAPLFNKEYYFQFDYSNIEALQKDQKELADTAEKLIRNGVMSPDQAGERFFGIEPIGGDAALRYLPINLVPIIGDGQKKSDDNGNGKSKSLSIYKEKEESFWMEKTRKKVLWDNFVKRVKAREKPFIPIAEDYQLRQGKDIVKAIKKYDDIKKIDANALMDAEKEIKEYKKAFNAWYYETLRQAGKSGKLNSKGMLYDMKMENIFKEGEDFEITPEMEERLQRMIFYSGTEVNQTTIAQIDRTLRRALAEAWTVEQFTQAIDAQIENFSVWKARLWARTESAKIGNWGRIEGYKQSEFVDKKIWLSAFTPDSRDTHMAADGQERLLNEPFDIGGELIQHPGDGSPENACNCLCTTAPKVMEI